KGIVNGSSSVNITFPKDKYRPNFDLRPYIVSERKFLQKMMTHLYWSSNFISLDERKRVVRALDWFNKSYKHDPEVQDIEKFISLSVAFESLFNASTEGVQSQILTGVTALVG